MPLIINLRWSEGFNSRFLTSARQFPQAKFYDVDDHTEETAWKKIHFVSSKFDLTTLYFLGQVFLLPHLGYVEGTNLPKTMT